MIPEPSLTDFPVPIYDDPAIATPVTPEMLSVAKILLQEMAKRNQDSFLFSEDIRMIRSSFLKDLKLSLGEIGDT